MMTRSDVGQIEPYWFGRPEAEIRAAAGARAEQWAPVPGWSRYLWSDKGRLRVSMNGKIMKTRTSNSGYELVNVIRDSDGKQVTVTVHSMVLLAHHPAFHGLDRFPGGLETRHNPVTGPLFNAYPEGLWPGTKAENAGDKYRHGQSRTPAATHPCINHARCGGLVVNPGRRCLPCAQEVGREAAALLSAGVSLADVTARLGYQTTEWVWKLARNHGGYTGTLADARSQRQSRARRVTYRVSVTLRSILGFKGR